MTAPARAPLRNYASLPTPERIGDVVPWRDVVRTLWDAFRTRADGDLGYSWVGFYHGPGTSNGDATARHDEMLLGAREPGPACSPISLVGACGRCYQSAQPLVVHDVAALGDGYIACNPRDRSEVVVPYFDDAGRVGGVLDVDGFDVGAFSATDAIELVAFLRRIGLCRGTKPVMPVEVG